MSQPLHERPEVYLLMDRLRDEYRRSRRGAEGFVLDAVGDGNATAGCVLAELIERDGEDFIQNAFDAVLGRAAAPDEVALHALPLPDGGSKLAFLRAIRSSHEGRSSNRPVHGLASGSSLHAPALPRLPESSGTFDFKSSYVVDDFLRFHGDEFLRNAYRGLLRRTPDRSGYDHFAARLKAGSLSKIEILGRIRFSREGRQARVVIHGLVVPFMVRTARRVPVLGQALGILQYLLRLPKVVQNLERLEGDVVRMHFDTARQFNAAAEQIEDHARRLGSRIDETDRGLEMNVVELASRLPGLASRKELDRVGIALSGRLGGQADKLKEVERDLGAVRDVARTARSSIDSLKHQVALEERRSLAAAQLNTEQIQGLRDAAASIRQRIDGLEDAATSIRHNAELLETHVRDRDERIASLQALVASDSGGTLRDDLIALRQVLAALRNEVLDQERQVARQLEAFVREDPATRSSGSSETSQPGISDRFYVAFEDRFRGSREEIMNRCQIYLPHVRAAGAGTDEHPILDVGCGRGEWLSLLQAQDIRASGIDINTAVVSECKRMGLDVVEADALDFLAEGPDAAFGAITGLHVIEHLPFRRFVALLDECRRALRSGGVLIFETPNPENVLVGSCTFYSDPTHVRPLPPETVRFVVESRGFERVEILRLHPYPEQLDTSSGDAELRATINNAFYGARDYAVIAHKPLALTMS